MTVINSSVFSGLTGADATLISRAVALINDPRLTSLEPLRQALASGQLVVRFATAADNVPANVQATFRDPVVNSQTGAVLTPGSVLIRADSLSRATDAAVLAFVDNVLHEGRGHGDPARIDARRLAVQDLVTNPSGLSTTARGDAYVREWLNDEAVARYTSFAFREQLATLGTGYSAVNRIQLESDVTYKEFARLNSVADGLGLSGAAKTSYVLEQSRPTVAAYGLNFYRDSASSYVIKTLNLNGTLEGATYDAHVKSTFNVVGYEVKDVVMHDDNSFSGSVVYANGNRRDMVFDSNGNLFQQRDSTANGDTTTTRYDVSGRTVSITDFDGAHNNSDYDTRIRNFDAQGREDLRTVTNDDGSRDLVDIDQKNERSDSSITSHLDAQGREDWRNTINDDGSRGWVDFDQDGSQTLSRYEARFDSQGREDWRNAIYDDGHRDWTDFDQGNAEALRQYEARFDSQGRLDWQNVIQDNGSRDWTDYDQDFSQAIRQYEAHFDGQGREDWRNIIMDDGSRTWTDFEQEGNQAIRQYEAGFDSQGREDWRNVIMDDGSRTWTDFDQANSGPLKTYEAKFDSQGREDYRNATLDNGRRDWYDFDQDNSQGWSRVEAHFDAQGREDYATMYNDDGSRVEIDYDQEGSHPWKSHAQIFDMFGREYSSETIYDPGVTDPTGPPRATGDINAPGMIYLPSNPAGGNAWILTDDGVFWEPRYDEVYGYF